MEKSKIELIVREYVSCREQKKALEERMKTLSEEIKNYAMSNAKKNDKGSYYLQDDTYTYGMSNRKSVKLDTDKALDFVKKNGFNNAIIVREEIDEDVISALVASGDITPEELEALTTVKETMSVYVGKNEDVSAEIMPEVQQKEVKKSISTSGGSKVRKVKR